MPTALIEQINGHHEDLLRALDQIEALASTSPPDDALLGKLDTLRHRLLAHELTTERFIVGPLRRLNLLDDKEIDPLEEELSRLELEADRLSRDHPDAGAAAALIHGIRRHLEHRARALGPPARSALAEGLLSGAPGWYVQETYELHGGPVAHTPEEWLG